MPSRRTSPTPPIAAGRRRAGIFHRESTRLRSNVADQVQRDLLPAGRMLSVFLILCELLAEVAVLIWSKGQSCDRPLRLWVQVLIVLQSGTVVLHCLNICQGRDTFGQHRNGLSATEIDMYNDAPATHVRAPSSNIPSSAPPPPDSNRTPTNVTDSVGIAVTPYAPPVVFDVSLQGDTNSRHDVGYVESTTVDDSADNPDTQPLLYSHSSNTSISENYEHSTPSPAASLTPALHPSQAPSGQGSPSFQLADDSPSTSQDLDPSHATPPAFTTRPVYISPEFVDRYVRIVNAWYLVWFLLGSVWVNDGGTCSKTAPHLYRLIVALTIIYYALLFLPLACFCLIVCCLPLFILVYRIMLPYAERERRRARAADPVQVQNLHSIDYSPETFRAHTGNENLDDASCVICLCDYETDEVVRFLPCKHHFHKECVDVWLRLDKACCLCKQDIDAPTTSTSLSAV